MPTDDLEQRQHFVEFERPLPVKMMSIDGTWCSDAYLIHISDTEAQIEATGQTGESAEFFLLLTSFGNPVYRRCRRKWVHGARIGVIFNNSKFGIKPKADGLRQNEEPMPHDG